MVSLMLRKTGHRWRVSRRPWNQRLVGHSYRLARQYLQLMLGFLLNRSAAHALPLASTCRVKLTGTEAVVTAAKRVIRNVVRIFGTI